MPSVAVAIAESIRADLTAHTFSVPVTVSRKYVPAWDLKEIDGIQITVVPRSNGLANADRSRLSNEVAVDVAVQRKVGYGTPAELDPLMDVVQEVTDFLTRLPVAGASWLRIANVPIYAPDHLHEKRMFTSVITCTYLIHR